MSRVSCFRGVGGSWFPRFRVVSGLILSFFFYGFVVSVISWFPRFRGVITDLEVKSN